MSAKGGLDLSDNNVSRVCGTQVEGLKCGKCRSPSLLVRSGSYNNAGNVWTLEEEKLPTFIQDAIELSGWTKGRLNCPHCQCRIGAFDFVSGGGGGGGGLDQAIHLVKSKVDESIIHSSSNI